MAKDYKQYNYSGYTYCNGSFASQACGPCAVADIVEVSPLTVAHWLTNNGYATNRQGTSWYGIAPALTAFGGGGVTLGTDMIRYPKPTAIEAFKGAIIDGRTGILCMGVGKSSYWTNSGHYIAVVGYKDGKYLVYDPASVARTGWHPWSDFEGDVKCAYTSTKRSGKGADDTYSFSVPQIKAGDTGKEVTFLQKLLCSRGMYERKAIDGSYGPKTEKAVRKYQKYISEHGGSLAQDGICGPATWENILGISGSVKIVHQVKEGDHNNYVYLAQELLYADGLYLSALDKNFGPATRAAVIAFQKNERIAQDGICGPTTFRRMIDL